MCVHVCVCTRVRVCVCIQNIHARRCIQTYTRTHTHTHTHTHAHTHPPTHRPPTHAPHAPHARIHPHRPTPSPTHPHTHARIRTDARTQARFTHLVCLHGLLEHTDDLLLVHNLVHGLGSAVLYACVCVCVFAKVCMCMSLCVCVCPRAFWWERRGGISFLSIEHEGMWVRTLHGPASRNTYPDKHSPTLTCK